MRSRRTVLTSIGSGVMLGTAGCLSSVPMVGPTEVDDGLVQKDQSRHSRSVQFIFDIDLDEGEWSASEYEIKGAYDLSVRLYTESGSVCAGVMSHQEFEKNYRDGDDDPYGYYTTASGKDGESHTEGTAEGSSDWVVIADNTGYFDDHEPDGHTEGMLRLTVH